MIVESPDAGSAARPRVLIAGIGNRRRIDQDLSVGGGRGRTICIRNGLNITKLTKLENPKVEWGTRFLALFLTLFSYSSSS